MEEWDYGMNGQEEVGLRRSDDVEFYVWTKLNRVAIETIFDLVACPSPPSDL